MYSILLVDDEQDVIEYFQRMLENGLAEYADVDIYTVYSSKEALELFEQYKFDIVITDVQMPQMSGIDMYHRIREQWSKTQIIFLSGYMEFQYAYAIAQDTHARFITKMEPTEKIVNTVLQAIEELEQEFHEQELLNQAIATNIKAIPLLQNNYLNTYLNGGYDTVSDIQEDFQYAEIRIDPAKPVYLVGMIIDGLPFDIKPKELEKYSRFVYSIGEKYLSADFESASYLYEGTKFPLFWILQRKIDSNAALDGRLEYIQHGFSRTIDKTLTCSYSEKICAYEDIPHIYEKMKNTLGYCSYSSDITENLIPCTDEELEGVELIDSSARVIKRNRLDRIQELESYMELDREEQYFVLFDDIVQPLLYIKSGRETVALEVYYRIVSVLLKFINIWKLNEKLAFMQEMYKLTRSDMHKNWEEAYQYLRLVSENIFALRFSKDVQGVDRYIVQVKNYIFENLAQDITLLQLSEYVHLNPSYLSRIFKRVTDMKLYDYIMEVRISKAKELLINSNYQIQQVAQKCGYESVQSFNRAFKKKTGKNPMDFRESQ